MVTINKDLVREELIKKNLYDNHKELVRQRHQRIYIMTLLISSLVLTVMFGTLQDPFIYTFSMIGNLFEYHILFIFWAIFVGTSILISVISLFKLENYNNRFSYIFIGLATLCLISTGFIPSIRHINYPLYAIHTAAATAMGFFVTFSLIPFVIKLIKESPRLKYVTIIWISFIWIGSLSTLVFFGKTGLFELYFFVTFIIFLLYLSLTLFEEKIVKLSIQFLKDEPNLNLAIEKIFIDLENKKKKEKKNNK